MVNIKNLTEEEFVSPGRSGCAGCAGVLVARLALKALGRETILVSATGCVLSNFTHAGAPKIPYMHSLFPGAGSLIAGIDAGLRAKGKRKGVNILGMGGDGGTADIGLQALSGALERGHDFIYICYDNEGYMNTGGQRSGTTPYGAKTATTPVDEMTQGEGRPMSTRKNMVYIVAAHRIPYVATASIAHVQDFLSKLEKATKISGPSYIHVLTPCNYRWGFPEDRSIEISRLAVRSRMFPLIEIEDGQKYHLQYRNRRKIPVSDYLSAQKRFSHLSDEDISAIQSYVNRNWHYLKNLTEISGE